MRSHEKPVSRFFFSSQVKLELEIQSGPAGPEATERARVAI